MQFDSLGITPPHRKDAIMLQLSIGTEVGVCDGVPRYERHRPEQTLLYQLVDRYYPAFEAQLAADRVDPMSKALI